MKFWYITKVATFPRTSAISRRAAQRCQTGPMSTTTQPQGVYVCFVFDECVHMPICFIHAISYMPTCFVNTKIEYSFYYSQICVWCVCVCVRACVRVRVWSCVYVWTVAVGYAVRKGATNGSLLPKPRIVTTNNLHRGANLKFLSVFPGFFVFLFFFECGRCYSSVTKTIHFERNDLAKLGRKLETNH